LLAAFAAAASPSYRSDVSGAFFIVPHIVFQLARHFLERRTIGIGLRPVRRLRLLSGVDFVEQLADQAECVNLIVMPAGR